MPKTLAALPRSQYATLFEVVLGKLLDLALCLAVVSRYARLRVSHYSAMAGSTSISPIATGTAGVQSIAMQRVRIGSGS
jgi:hypothetical protein